MACPQAEPENTSGGDVTKPSVDITVVSPKGTETVIESKASAATAGAEPSEDNIADNNSVGAVNGSEFVNQQGVTFEKGVDEVTGPTPYGLPCVRELFRFLISLINPNERSGNPGVGSSAGSLGQTGYHNESMIQVALTLLSAALETGASHLHKFESLLELAKDDLPRNLIALLKSERVSIFSSALWIRSGLFFLFAFCKKVVKNALIPREGKSMQQPNSSWSWTI